MPNAAAKKVEGFKGLKSLRRLLDERVIDPVDFHTRNRWIREHLSGEEEHPLVEKLSIEILRSRGLELPYPIEDAVAEAA